MSRSWRLIVAGAHVVFALAFTAGLYLYLVGLAPQLDLPLSPVAVLEPVDPSSREDRAPTTNVGPVAPPVQPPSARTAPPTAPPRTPNVVIVPPVTPAPPSEAAASLPVVAAEAIVKMSMLVFASPGHAPHEHALPAQAAARAVIATARSDRPPRSRA